MLCNSLLTSEMTITIRQFVDINEAPQKFMISNKCAIPYPRISIVNDIVIQILKSWTQCELCSQYFNIVINALSCNNFMAFSCLKLEKKFNLWLPTRWEHDHNLKVHIELLFVPFSLNLPN